MMARYCIKTHKKKQQQINNSANDIDKVMSLWIVHLLIFNIKGASILLFLLKDSKKCCLYPKTRYHSDPMIIQIYLFPTIFFYNSTILILVPNCLILKLRDIVKNAPEWISKTKWRQKRGCQDSYVKLDSSWFPLWIWIHIFKGGKMYVSRAWTRLLRRQ